MEFDRLKMEIERDTGPMTEKANRSKCPDHRRIVEAGMSAVPFMISDIKVSIKGGKKIPLWFDTLRMIAGPGPARKANGGGPKKLATAWIEWWDSIPVSDMLRS